MDSGYLEKKDDGIGPAAGEKRKKSNTPEQEANKATKIVSSPQPKYQSPTPKDLSPKPDLKAKPAQVLTYLLSATALEICLPPDEFSAITSTSPSPRTYSDLLSPFEELLCAVILSRPISHRLGLRTIRTILNPPYEFRDPVAIKTAGPKKVLEALETARTQHKGKIADEITLLADAVSDNDWHNDLSKLRAQSKNAVGSEREVLRGSIKGLGKTGLDIFYRRVQWQWDEAYPFIDARTQIALEKLGLPKRAEGVQKMIEVRWKELRFEDGREGSVDEKRQRAFVMLLERAVGADLEEKVEEVLEQASNV